MFTCSCADSLLERIPTFCGSKLQNPATMLRAGRQHLIKITVISGSHVAVELPISSILTCKLWPVDLDSDIANLDIYPLSQDAFCMEGVGIWRTTDHHHLALKVPGTVQVGTAIGLQLNNSNENIVVRHFAVNKIYPCIFL